MQPQVRPAASNGAIVWYETSRRCTHAPEAVALTRGRTCVMYAPFCRIVYQFSLRPPRCRCQHAMVVALPSHTFNCYWTLTTTYRYTACFLQAKRPVCGKGLNSPIPTDLRPLQSNAANKKHPGAQPAVFGFWRQLLIRCKAAGRNKRWSFDNVRRGATGCHQRARSKLVPAVEQLQ